jgi:hypothetical protein
MDAHGPTDERLSGADGEAVWSWRPDAGVKFRVGSKGFREATVASRHWLTEESAE